MIRPAVVLLVFFTALTGLAFPLALTLAAPDELEPGAVGRVFDAPDVFWGRPTAGTALASSGSNLGPTNPAFLDAVRGRVEAMRKAHPTHAEPVPADLVTASASGIDPHLSVAGAKYQVERVALARHVDPAQLSALIDQLAEPRLLGIFGEPRVNVVRLNQALPQLPSPSSQR
jgi:K+-transporting ATPase ATPase C chain